MEKILAEALHFAAFKHRYQQRVYKGQQSIPYLNHPIDLLHILAVEAGIEDMNVLAAALLHDTVEDTETTSAELLETFGEKITGIVLELTEDQTPPVLERYAAQLKKTPDYSYEARLVKLADRIANLRDAIFAPMPNWSPERLAGHFSQGRKQVDLLAGTHPILEKLFNDAYETISKSA